MFPKTWYFYVTVNRQGLLSNSFLNFVFLLNDDAKSNIFMRIIMINTTETNKVLSIYQGKFEKMCTASRVCMSSSRRFYKSILLCIQIPAYSCIIRNKFRLKIYVNFYPFLSDDCGFVARWRDDTHFWINLTKAAFVTTFPPQLSLFLKR